MKSSFFVLLSVLVTFEIVLYTYTEDSLVTVLPDHEGRVCSNLRPGGFKAWNKGFVSTFTPEVSVNCTKIVSGNEEELNRVKTLMVTWRNSVSDEELMKRVQNCSWLRDSFENNLYNSDLEREFPLAFTFVVHNSPGQFLRLLRLLYRPQNTYCIHPDVKSPYRQLFESVASCFNNVIIPSKLENVVWGYYTIMAAQMNCMKDLLLHRQRNLDKWKYIINLCGKELPLVTNRQMVSKLMKLNGSSSILTTSNNNIGRIKYKAKLNKNKNGVWVDNKSPLKPPFDLNDYHKSSSYNAISYQFANFLVNNSTSKKIYEFFSNCSNPEEHYYATMYMMPGVPGGFSKDIPKENYFKVAKAFWYKKDCAGKTVHSVCIVSAADLMKVSRIKDEFFFNKYFIDYDHTVMDCMEERVVKHNMLEYQEECPDVMVL